MIDPVALSAYWWVWYLFTISTYGVWVPAGLFLPGIILGCAGGAIFEGIRSDLFDIDPTLLAVGPIICCGGAFLAGYTRMTYSLVVIMLETTSSINLFIPMMLNVFLARAVGNIFTRSLYDTALRIKNIPLLRSSAPKQTRNVRADVVMAKNPVALQSVCDMDSIRTALETTHNAFPVLNVSGKLVGLIPKNILVTLVVKKAFYDKSLIELKEKVSTTSINNGDNSEQRLVS